MESLALAVMIIFLGAFVAAGAAVVVGALAVRRGHASSVSWVVVVLAVMVNAFLSVQSLRLGGVPLALSLLGAALVVRARMTSRTVDGPL